MPHLGVAESRTCSGGAHSMSQNRPNKLGTPHCPGLPDKLLGIYNHHILEK